MKKLTIISLLTFLCVSKAFANPLSPDSEELKGPVKKVTSILSLDNTSYSLYYGEQSGGTGKKISWYDSRGQLIEEADYIGDNLQNGYVRQYTINNVYMEYEYDKNGIIKGAFAQVQSDSLGHQLFSRRYKEGKLIYADSTVYDTLGRMIEYYETPYKKGLEFLVLKSTYEYDSIGRLAKVKNIRDSNNYTIEYFPNGNYTEHHINKYGKQWDREYIVNDKGQVKKINEPNMHVRYIKFDKYGNWLRMQSTAYHTATVTTERTIEYYE